jgi:nucleotide-binding universal stress UspA family protein
MYKILVPVDGSDNALRAVHYAISVAREHRSATIYLVNVHPEPIVYGEISLYVDRAKVEAAQRDHAEALLKPAAEAVAAAGIPFTKEILIGDVAPSVVRRAEELGCDVIVMGTRGLAALGGFVMGSVATKVVHLTKLPVTLVK